MNLTSRFISHTADRTRRRCPNPAARPARTALFVELLESRIAFDISVNFVGGRGIPPTGSDPMGPAEVAGVVPRSNWNNAALAGGLPGTPLVSHTGATIPGSLILYGGANVWTTGIPESPGDTRMMNGYLDSSNQSLTIVIIWVADHFGANPYDVYVYASGDQPGTGRFGFYTILSEGGVSFRRGDDTVGFQGTYFEDTGTGGNYLKISGVQGELFGIFASAWNPQNPEVNGFRAPINGIQMVAAGESPGRPVPGPRGVDEGLVDQVLVDGLAPIVTLPAIPVEGGSPLAIRSPDASRVDALFAAAGQDDLALAVLPPQASSRTDDVFVGDLGEEVFVI